MEVQAEGAEEAGGAKGAERAEGGTLCTHEAK